MPKIKNYTLANAKRVLISNEYVDFDKDGIGEIKSEELYKSVLELANFFAVEEPIITEPEPAAEPIVEEPVQVVKKEVSKPSKAPAKK